MNLLNLHKTNRICPRCKNPNYMVSLGGVSDEFQYKCINCNSYFTFDDLTSRTSTITVNSEPPKPTTFEDLGYVQVIRCKDCKHRGNSEKCVLSAISKEKDFPLFMLDNRGEWFCADGERREENG